MTPKEFVEKLNQCLDDSDAPKALNKRAEALSVTLDISRQEAHSLLAAQQLPSDDMINQIANVFEVEPNWLAGKTQGPRP